MLDTLKRAFKKFQADEMNDRAAAMTYYVMMSLFPGLLVAVSLLGLLGTASLVTDAVKYATDHGAPEEVTDALKALLSKTIASANGAVTSALVIGVVVAIYGASGAFGGAGRSLNTVYGVRESRGFVVHKLTDIAWTLVTMVLAIVAMVSVFLGSGLARDLFEAIGIGDGHVVAEIWRYARWLVAVAAVLLMYAITYSFAPDIKPRRLRWITPGAAAGVTIWAFASAGFFFYVSNFGKYGATYGAFAGAIILLLWIYLSSLAFLFGAELNAEREREQRPPSSYPPPPSPQPPPSWPSTGGNGDGRYVDEKYGRDALAR